MLLIEQLTGEIERLPQLLNRSVVPSLKELAKKLSSLEYIASKEADFNASLIKVFACSQFVANSCLYNPGLVIDLFSSGELVIKKSPEQFRENVNAFSFSSEAELMRELRCFRRREMIRIAWRDLAGWAELSETLTELSVLAETCIQFALDYLYQQACLKRGVPKLSDGSPQQLVVLGMGKLGAGELNFSSDIDLIFAYAEEGVLADRKATTYSEFFTRLCRSLVKVLDEITEDGFVFRTDIRLRPFGDSGPIVMSFEGMENYYQTQAREWERYAMIKASQVAGDRNSGAQLLKMLKPFVFRRYLDYGAFEELRTLKFKITQELQRKDRLDNIKLGPGGIREIEFIGQAFQLIRGGNEVSLQQRGIQQILQALAELGLLAAATVEMLAQAYCFLRRVENHIQQYQDKQTHDLPSEGVQQVALAYSMGFNDWPSFKEKLDSVRQKVQEEFEQVFSLSQQDVAHHLGKSLWAGNAEDSCLLEQLQDLGYFQPQETFALIRGFKNSAAVNRLTAKGAHIVDQLMPQLLEGVCREKNPDQTLKRILVLIEAVAGRNVYLALLAENPDALSQLIRLSSASPWISAYLSRYPVLFDELLDNRSLYEPLNKQDLENRLRQQLHKTDCNDLEQLMIALRKFKQINVLRVAAADIMGAIPVMVVSDYLTLIAKVILRQVVAQSWRILVAKHGAPPDAAEQVSGFGVVGFGKMGGIELGYGSDLDLVFLYACKDGNAITGGDKPISCMQFYGRLGQKVMSMLNTNMLSGILYEVDMRLRPSGNSGLLVNHVKAYEDYLEKDAWTWELQALVRGRFIAGDELIKNSFTNIRKKILCACRDVEKLKKEVSGMREKMRDSLLKQQAGKFDIKHSKGGIADIEFIVQFHILAWASQCAALVAYTDNVRLLAGLREHGYISENAAHTLQKAYCTFRDRGHREVLQGNKAVTEAMEFDELREQVLQIWDQTMHEQI